MKKIIVSIMSVLMLFMTSLVSTFASVEVPLAHEPTLEDVKAIYNDIFYNYKYDCRMDFIADPSVTMKEKFERNVEFIKENKVGQEKQLVYLLIDRLTNIGVKAVEAQVFSSDRGFLRKRMVVVYELEGKKYVADVFLDKVYNHNEGKPIMFNMTLDEYLSFLKNKLIEVVCDVMIYKEPPQNIDKLLVDIRPGVDYDFIAIE